ncbi:hypothetical protein [Sorangium cellulosum]|uniref:hypothetical protein n=1 Tax=Sorangium cellulosum TaxID=56 RepID=UPI000CF46932|nr:hypothetical protein [Sorangium cellulosum]
MLNRDSGGGAYRARDDFGWGVGALPPVSHVADLAGTPERLVASASFYGAEPFRQNLSRTDGTAWTLNHDWMYFATSSDVKLPPRIWSDGRWVATAVDLGSYKYDGGLANTAVLCDLGP